MSWFKTIVREPLAFLESDRGRHRPGAAGRLPGTRATWAIASLLCVLVVPARAAAAARFTSAKVIEKTAVLRLAPSGRVGDREARVGDTVQGADLLRTGPKGSTAAIEFNDNATGVRLMSDTVFTFSTGTVHVAKGLALITGDQIGCGTSALFARVNSTAIIEAFETESRKGGPRRYGTKFILLEGSATVSTPDGTQSKTLRGGHMIVQFAGAPTLADIQEVDVKRLLKESRLITGFKSSLPGLAKIQEVVARQQRELWRGTLERTSVTTGGRGRDPFPEPGKSDFEAPFDPDIGGAVKDSPPPCPACH